MPAAPQFLAFDLGAESGRGLLQGQHLRLEVVHRFPNGPVRTLNTLNRDALRLLRVSEKYYRSGGLSRAGRGPVAGCRGGRRCQVLACRRGRPCPCRELAAVGRDAPQV
jgi:hypothetical protein